MRRAVLAIALAAVAVAAACAPKPTLQASWPRADSERTVSQPAQEAVWPLTGKPALDATSAATPSVVLAVTGAPSAALPGIESADVVFEIVPGGQPRRVAVFHSSLPAAAGPLRTTSSGDRAIATAFSATLAGGSGSLADVASVASAPATSAGAPPVLPFAAESALPASSTPAAGLRFMLWQGTQAEWRWDKAAERYQRFVGGKASTASPGVPVRASNVIVMWTLRPNGWPGSTLAGVGRASIFLGGRKIAGSWEATGGAPAFYDTSRAPVSLRPGNTWIEVIGNAEDIVVR